MTLSPRSVSCGKVTFKCFIRFDPTPSEVAWSMPVALQPLGALTCSACGAAGSQLVAHFQTLCPALPAFSAMQLPESEWLLEGLEQVPAAPNSQASAVLCSTSAAMTRRTANAGGNARAHTRCAGL